MIADEDIVDTIYMPVYNTGMFYENCNKWDDKQCDKKIWANLQAHFEKKQRKYKRKHKVSTRAGGYHGANNLREMDGTHDALLNLETAYTADRETMMLQCTTIADLTVSVAALTQKLQQANTGYNRGAGLPVDRWDQANPKGVNGKHVSDVGSY